MLFFLYDVKVNMHKISKAKHMFSKGICCKNNAFLICVRNSCVPLTGCMLLLAILHRISLHIEHYIQTVQPLSPILASLIDIIDLYHFVLLSVVLTLDDIHKVSAVGFVFLHTSQLIRMKFDMVPREFNWNIMLFQSEIFVIKGNNH